MHAALVRTRACPLLAPQVACLDALALAPAAVQRAVQQRREQAAREEAVWEELAATSVGGGGTFITSEATCGQCGERRAQVHSILSGGTYAQVSTRWQLVAAARAAQRKQRAPRTHAAAAAGAAADAA